MKKRRIIALFLLLILLAGCLGYLCSYYPAQPEALKALEGTADVTITETDYGYLFDGAGEDNILIFYPGAKVDERAYAPMLSSLAAAGCDAALVKMPLHMAFFGMNKAKDIPTSDYANVYIGGHSLGGAMAAYYAASHEELTGVVLFGAYSVKPLSMDVLCIAGSEDGVLNWAKHDLGMELAKLIEVVIPGGNHALFGNYGFQEGDNAASINWQSQQAQAVEALMDFINSHN